MKRVGLYERLIAAGGHHVTRHVTYDESLDPAAAESGALPLGIFKEGVPGPLCLGHPRHCQTLIEAAVDAGAGRFRVLTEVVIPLSKTGIALGSIFVITLVMGDFFVVKIMSGGRSASVVMAVFEDVNLLFYPPAAASAVLLLIIVTLIVSFILRVVDVRKELMG